MIQSNSCFNSLLSTTPVKSSLLLKYFLLFVKKHSIFRKIDRTFSLFHFQSVFFIDFVFVSKNSEMLQRMTESKVFSIGENNNFSYLWKPRLKTFWKKKTVPLSRSFQKKKVLLFVLFAENLNERELDLFWEKSQPLNVLFSSWKEVRHDCFLKTLLNNIISWREDILP